MAANHPKSDRTRRLGCHVADRAACDDVRVHSSAQESGERCARHGTAIYLTPDPAGWEATWALWTTIVREVPGCLGVTGGWMVEPMEEQLCYVVYVGWASVEVHDAYHHTNHFRQRVVILRKHNQGYREYGHVAFTHSRTRRPANL